MMNHRDRWIFLTVLLSDFPKIINYYPSPFLPLRYIHIIVLSLNNKLPQLWKAEGSLWILNFCIVLLLVVVDNVTYSSPTFIVSTNQYP